MSIASKLRLPYIFIKSRDITYLKTCRIEKEQLHEEITQATEFVEGIRQGNLDVEYVGLNDDKSKLAESLLDMRDHMKRTAEQEKQRNWITEGLAQFADILRADYESLKDFSNLVISSLVEYMGVNQGGIFILDKDDDNNDYLELQGCYAYGRKKFHQKRFSPGEGLVGQAFLERESIYLKEIPKDYLTITSGLGEATPRTVLIVPLMLNDEVYGIIELASFHEIPQYQIDFMLKVGENIASTVAAVKTAEHTQGLLEETQQTTEELRAQEEEMRQSVEELQVIQEGMERKQNEIIESESKSRAIFQGSMDSIFTFDEKGIIEDINKTAANTFLFDHDELIGRDITTVIKGLNLSNYAKLLTTTRRMRGIRKDGSLFTMEVSMSEASLVKGKQLVLYARDISKMLERETQIAESLMELDKMRAELQALKKVESKNLDSSN
ncbi:GAF domain-containing protein [Fulvivirgaceae bacterium BMA10]|uniref:GAF domain-containing protein n=1 Tax=Splendidivirga corallicola TaxID=3051826 RepID=A0ABT8KQC2_9BACT|nr:GAF domain-containing protein [Fulvivirgaceae bacterium BMA10]